MEEKFDKFYAEWLDRNARNDKSFALSKFFLRFSSFGVAIYVAISLFRLIFV